MSRHNETPLLTAKVSNGGSAFESWIPSEYRNPPLPSKELAVAVIARRFGLRPHVARLICELAALGGRRS